MTTLPQVYQKYNLLFTPQLIPQLRDLRGEQWADLIDTLTTLPETHPDALAFSLMMIELGRCLSCQMDSYRAQRGCATCAEHTVVSFKGSDKQLLIRFEKAQQTIQRRLAEFNSELKRAA